MERFEAFSTSTLRRMVVHSFMSLCTLLPSALVPSWTRKPGRRAKQIRGWSGAVVFDRDLQAPRAVTFDRFLHSGLPPESCHKIQRPGDQEESICPCPIHHCPRCIKHDLQVPPERPRSDIEVVELAEIFRTQLIATRDLPQSGDAGPHFESPRCPTFKLGLLRNKGPGANDGHVSSENVEQLW